MRNMELDDIQAVWRRNGSPNNHEYMLCHNYTNDLFFVMPRCDVCSEFYIPTTYDYIAKFIKFNDFNVELPNKIDGIFKLGLGTKQLASKLKYAFDYTTYTYSKYYPIVSNGYAEFKKFIISLGVN